MRRIGAHVSTSGGIKNAITNSLNIGGNCIQIFAGSPRMWKRSLYNQKDIDQFRTLIDEHDLDPIFIHALYLTNLASDKDELREKSRQALVMDMKNSALIGAAGVILHIGSHQGRGFEVVEEIVVEEINAVLDDTPSDSILLLENSAGQKGKIGSLQELGVLLEKLDNKRVGICLDTAHAFEAGYAINTDQGIKIFVSDIEKYLGIDKVVVIHLNDSRTKLGSGHDQHENIGEGFIGKKGIANIVLHPKLSHLPLILEVPGFEGTGPDAQNVRLVRSLLQ